MSLRGAYSIAAVAVLLVLPWDHAWVPLVLLASVAFGATNRPARPQSASVAPVVPLVGDLATIALSRRTVPELRMRRPARAIAAQTSWRQAAETGRRRRDRLS